MKTKFIWKRMPVLILSLVMMIMPSLKVSATEKEPMGESKVERLEMISMDCELESGYNNITPKALLYNCLIDVNCSNSGMRVTFSTDCTQTSSSIGVKDIVIKQQVWYGWKTVATSSGGYYTNASMYLGTILYADAIKGENYRITCVHYADADEYTEVEGRLEFIFTY